MPPLQATAFYSDSPTQGRRAQRRSSARVPFEVLHSAKLGIVQPEPEEPQGTCLYAHGSVLTAGDYEAAIRSIKNDRLRQNASASAASASPRVSVSSPEAAVRRNSRVHGKQRASLRAARIQAANNGSCAPSSVFAWMGCTDNPCIIS